MTETLQVFIQAVIQGLTEFLPVSSSGHLVLAGRLIGVRSDMVYMGAMLHLGTLLSVICYYRKDIGELLTGTLAGKRDSVEYLLKILLTTVITVSIVFLLKDSLMDLYGNMALLSSMWVLTAFLLLISGNKKDGFGDITWKGAALVGLVQSAAVLPGLSRSGAVLAAVLLLGTGRKNGLRYVFLISIPVIAGAAFFSLMKDGAGTLGLLPLIMGVFISFLVGLFSIRFLITVTSAGKLKYFSFYLFALAFFTLVFYI